MFRIAMKVMFGVSLLLPVLSASSQEKPSKEEPQAAHPRAEGPQLKVQVVFAEFEGDKKVKSLPYSFLVKASTEDDRDRTKIRMGSRVPISTGASPATPASIQYVDVGTNIDCVARQTPDGTYRVTLNLERSWAEDDLASKIDKSSNSAPPEKADGSFRPPVICQFRSEGTVTIRDGQTLETDSATDPVTGKVIRLEVTVNVLK
jgi:hypothetical protein